MRCEIAKRADFSLIRYGQCWEDADILLEALDIRPGHTCLAIASAGDNALAMLSRAPDRVIALDVSPAQLACLQLRVAAYRELDHAGLLELMGSTPSRRRPELYRRCRPLLSFEARDFWDAHSNEVAAGIGGAGKFERYFALFRNRILPLVHSKSRVERLLSGGTPSERERFYSEEWDSWAWRRMFRIFFSRFVMGRMGRDLEFFKYAEGSVSERILKRVRHALTALDARENPYLQWILTGRHTTALPYALRPENFEAIRSNLDRLEWSKKSLENFLARSDSETIDRFNLSDIFEYVSADNYHDLLGRLARTSRKGGRLVYWNLLARRQRPDWMAELLRPLSNIAEKLRGEDKAFFYSAFVVEEVL